jgi:hypothetical protein
LQKNFPAQQWQLAAANFPAPLFCFKSFLVFSAFLLLSSLFAAAGRRPFLQLSSSHFCPIFVSSFHPFLPFLSPPSIHPSLPSISISISFRPFIPIPIFPFFSKRRKVARPGEGGQGVVVVVVQEAVAPVGADVAGPGRAFVAEQKKRLCLN